MDMCFNRKKKKEAFSGLDNSLLEPYFLASHIFACPEEQGLYCCWLVLIFCYVDNPVTISPLLIFCKQYLHGIFQARRFQEF